MTYGQLSFNRPVHQSRPKCTIQPVAECITLAQAKLQCRVDADITTEDDLISALIVAARNYAEVEQWRALLTSTWVYSLDNFPIWSTSNFVPGEIRLPLPPIQSVTSVQYYDATNTLQTLDPSLYYVDTQSEPGRIVPVFGMAWPVITWTRPNSVQVTFVAGYTTAPPQTTIQAMLLWIGGMYMQRENFTTESLSNVPGPMGDCVSSLLSMDKWGGGIA